MSILAASMQIQAYMKTTDPKCGLPNKCMKCVVHSSSRPGFMNCPRTCCPPYSLVLLQVPMLTPLERKCNAHCTDVAFVSFEHQGNWCASHQGHLFNTLQGSSCGTSELAPTSTTGIALQWLLDAPASSSLRQSHGFIRISQETAICYPLVGTCLFRKFMGTLKSAHGKRSRNGKHRTCRGARRALVSTLILALFGVGMSSDAH